MVTKHMNFLYSECKEMVATEKSTDLRNLYILLKPVTDGLKRLIEVFLEHIKEQGKKTISCMKGDSVSSACGSRFNPSDAITNSTSCCSQRYTYNLWKTCWTCIESTKS